MKPASENSRLGPSPSELIDRSRVVTFQFEGRVVQANQGDTVASALFANGTTILSRSFKYHRPRGLLCAAGRCPNCLVTVDGVPNVRACTQLLRPHMSVRRQNAWPSADRDLASILDRMGKFMPVGFYYKTFHRPKLFWKLAQPIIRRVAGLGSLRLDSQRDADYRHINHHADILVIGGGPAGLYAALEASRAGSRTLLVDDQTALGGHLRFDARIYKGIEGLGEQRGFEIADRLATEVHESPQIDVLLDSTAFGFYQDNLIGVLSPDSLVRVRAKRVVLATGAYEIPLVFDGNDLPGVMLSTAAQRLIHLYRVRPGNTAVVATIDDQGYYAALDLINAGLQVAAVVDSRPEFPRGMEAAEDLRSQGVLVLNDHAVTKVEGKRRAVRAIITQLDDGTERLFDCDLVCMSGGFQEANALLYQAGGKLRHDETLNSTVPIELPATIYAAGHVTGIGGLTTSLLQGRLSGLEAAVSLKEAATVTQVELDALRREVDASVDGYRTSHKASMTKLGIADGKRRFVCFCEDITASDISDAISEGFDDIQTLKRYSTVTMGPCQGKMCLRSFVSLCAEHTGRSIDETGVTTMRPPIQPVTLGALAGPSHLPIKRTPMDRIHRRLGATIVDVGPWQRAYSYGDPQNECRAVRERVGIIDVSTLGKLDVTGRDAPRLLDKVYTHRFSDLKIGRIRYGVLCSEDGTILDDGTVTRLAEDRYFVTTTTGNVELTEEWFKWWMAGTEICAHVTNVTSSYAAINVAGPRARDTLSKLTEIDLSRTAFRYMRSKSGTVAHVPATLLRIGFVGETGWEVHFPSEYGEHMWEALMDAGSEFGIAPFGLEAQRILRLEKGHIIVAQDTNAVSNPLEAGMDWVVQFEKEDFIGRGGLMAISKRGLRNKLVGFVMRDSRIPSDGDAVIRGSSPIGMVTSARLSPTLGKGFGLAWVPIELAKEGRKILIRVNGQNIPADVTLRPVYDPDGMRLRD